MREEEHYNSHKIAKMLAIKSDYVACADFSPVDFLTVNMIDFEIRSTAVVGLFFFSQHVEFSLKITNGRFCCAAGKDSSAFRVAPLTALG